MAQLEVWVYICRLQAQTVHNTGQLVAMSGICRRFLEEVDARRQSSCVSKLLLFRSRLLCSALVLSELSHDFVHVWRRPRLCRSLDRRGNRLTLASKEGSKRRKLAVQLRKVWLRCRSKAWCLGWAGHLGEQSCKVCI